MNLMNCCYFLNLIPVRVQKPFSWWQMLLQLFSIMLCACALLNVAWQENEGQK